MARTAREGVGEKKEARRKKKKRKKKTPERPFFLFFLFLSSFLSERCSQPSSLTFHRSLFPPTPFLSLLSPSPRSTTFSKTTIMFIPIAEGMRGRDINEILMHLAALSSASQCAAGQSSAKSSACSMPEQQQRCAQASPPLSSAAATAAAAPKFARETKSAPSHAPGTPPRAPKATTTTTTQSVSLSKKDNDDAVGGVDSGRLQSYHRVSPSSGTHFFSLDLPGRSLSSFDISVEERDGGGCAPRLYIHASAIQPDRGDGEEENERMFFAPRRALGISLDLPADADLARVSADYDAGVLSVRVPVAQKKAPRRFRVKVGGGGGGGAKSVAHEEAKKKKVEEEEEENEAKDSVANDDDDDDTNNNINVVFVPNSARSSSASPLEAVAAALARASLKNNGKKNEAEDDEEEEDGSWKEVSSEDEDDKDEDEEERATRVRKNSSTSSSSAAARRRSVKKEQPSGNAVLEAIEDP